MSTSVSPGQDYIIPIPGQQGCLSCGMHVTVVGALCAVCQYGVVQGQVQVLVNAARREYQINSAYKTRRGN